MRLNLFSPTVIGGQMTDTLLFATKKKAERRLNVVDRVDRVKLFVRVLLIKDAELVIKNVSRHHLMILKKLISENWMILNNLKFSVGKLQQLYLTH